MTETVTVPSYAHIGDIEVNGKKFAVFEPGRWHCTRCEAVVNDPLLLDIYGHCARCAQDCCPTCGDEVVEESVQVLAATHCEPAEYSRHWLCLGCGWEESE